MIMKYLIYIYIIMYTYIYIHVYTHVAALCSPGIVEHGLVDALGCFEGTVFQNHTASQPQNEDPLSSGGLF